MAFAESPPGDRWVRAARPRAAPPLCPAPGPPAPLRRPRPARSPSPYLGAPACRAGRAGLSAPATTATLLKKPERAAPLSLYVRARVRSPHPRGSGRCCRPPGAHSLCGAAPAASVLRSSTPPVLLSLRTVAPLGARLAAALPLCAGAVEQYQTWAPGKAAALPLLPLLAVLQRRKGGKGRKQVPTLELRLSGPSSAPRHLALLCLAAGSAFTPERESVWHN